MDNAPGSSEMPERRISYPNLVDTTRNNVSQPQGRLDLIIVRNEQGYGLTVSGDNPVFVQDVKEGGAAEKAGVQNGDVIIKVNRTPVLNCNHTEVVELIRSDVNVLLTVYRQPAFQQLEQQQFLRQSALSSSHRHHQNPPNHRGKTVMPTHSFRSSSPASHHHHHHHHRSQADHNARASDRITAPKPADHQQQLQMDYQRVHTIKLMLEKEERHLEALRSENARTNSRRTAEEIQGAERRIRALRDQLNNAGTAVDLASAIPPSSSVYTHQRTRSNPDSFVVPGYANSDGRVRLTSSDSVSDLNLNLVNKRPKTGNWDVQESPRGTPPGTPPPPYRGNSSGGGGNNAVATNVDKDDCDGDQESVGLPCLESPALTPNTCPSSNLASPCESSASRPTFLQLGTQVMSPDGHCRTSSIGSRPFGKQAQIMSMDDDDFSDPEQSQMEDHGPFNSLSKLWKHNAHLSVFMNYVVSNSDPSSLLFYLITDLYKEGSAKEMKKWAYEIYSSFLVPGAPLRLVRVVENVALEIDNVLQKESDKEEILRKVFWKARLKAKEELNEQLEDFRRKRTAGLGTVFGPSDAQLEESIHDKTKEAKIVEGCLMQQLESHVEDIENGSDRNAALASSLATVLSKIFGIRSQHATCLIEKCPSFVSKDKSLKTRFMGRGKKQYVVGGHHLNPHQYFAVTYCNVCYLLIWGIAPQAYQCADCGINVHRGCFHNIDEFQTCAGSMLKKEKGGDRISKIMDKLRPEKETKRKPSALHLSPSDRLKRTVEESPDGADSPLGDRAGAVSSSKNSGERRSDSFKEGNEDGGTELRNDGSEHGSPHQPLRRQSGTSISRSESYKERVQKRQTRERRKTSDPNLSKTSDVDLDGQQGLSSYATHSGSSSNSSLSTSLPFPRSLDSPSNSLEMVTGPAGRASTTPDAAGFLPSAASPSTSTVGSGSVQLSKGSAGWDSDFEVENDQPDWTLDVDEDVLRELDSKEKKRQEVVNELFYTERSHVKNLKVLDRVFFRPMSENQILPSEQLNLLFANIDEMIAIHGRFNAAMKAKRKMNPVVGDIGELLLEMFDGSNGEQFQNAVATFCSHQHVALEALKERRKKDGRLSTFLADAEQNPVCRRLQLKDLIPSAMQRLTKYPLLFETVLRCTPRDSRAEEWRSVQRALERSKEILNSVNQAVREAGDRQRLCEIQRRLDKSALDKMDHSTFPELKNLDLTKHSLIHEGELTWLRTGSSNSRQKQMDLHVILLDDFILLLQKQDDRYVLKQHEMNIVSGREDTKHAYSPIIRLAKVHVREVATDTRAFFLVNLSHSSAFYQLIASTASEKNTWFRHITEAAEAYKLREGKHHLGSGQPTPTTPAELDDGKVTDEREDEDAGSEANTEAAAAAKESGGSAESPVLPPSTLLSPGSAELAPTSPSQQRRLQKVELLRITDHSSSLIEPSEVVVSQGAVLTAEPVLMPIEKLRRKDEQIRLALEEKQQLVADILHVPVQDFENVAELAGEELTSELGEEKDANEVILAAMLQAKRLNAVVNDCLKATEEEAVIAASGTSPRTSRKARAPAAPVSKLVGIATSLNSQLTQLLGIIHDRDAERERLRRELQRTREQVHILHENRRVEQKTTDESAPASNSNSFASGDAEAPKGCGTKEVVQTETENDVQKPDDTSGSSTETEDDND